ncbi:MAG: hypothetical protein QM703_07475 [Gemmatales bacterium]
MGGRWSCTARGGEAAGALTGEPADAFNLGGGGSLGGGHLSTDALEQLGHLFTGDVVAPFIGHLEPFGEVLGRSCFVAGVDQALAEELVGLGELRVQFDCLLE